MLNKIIRYSLHNRLLVLAASALLMAAGLYTTTRTEVDVFPDLNAPTVVVMTEATGMAAEEVEQTVTFPLETAVNGATGVRRVRSASSAGFSVVWVEFDWDTDIYLARQIVSEKIATVADQMPPGVGSPTLGPQSSILGEMLIVGLTADSTSMLDLRTIADWTIRPRLLATGGVAQVAVLGGDIREYQILISSQRMTHRGVTLGEVMAAVEGMNQNSAGGVIYQYGNEYVVRGVSSTTDPAEIGSAVVKSVDGVPVTLSDVADVRVGGQQPKLGVASEKGRPAVLLTVTKQPNTGTLELTDKLEDALAELSQCLPADVHVSTDVFRQSRFIESSIGNVRSALAEGAVFVVVVLFLFLANVRTTVISLVTLPLSLLVAMLVMHLMHVGINTMTLGGLAIAIGSLVDDAIVDVENVWKHIRLNNALPTEQKKPLLDVVFEASREVRMPILNSTLIIIASFVPLFFLSGMEGRMLIPLGIAFIVALLASTVVALTLTPVLCNLMLRSHSSGPAEAREAPIAAWLKRHYSRLLLAALGHKRLVLGTTVALLIGAIATFATLGRSFLPPFNEGSFTINISTLPGVSLAESDSIGRRAEMMLLEVPEILTVARKTGRAELDEHALGVNVSEIEAPFDLAHRSHAQLLDDIRHRLSAIPGANIEIGQPISHRIDAMLSGTQASIAIKVFGDDLGKMYAIGNQIKAAISTVEGIADLNVEQQIERPELAIVPRRDVMAKLGITMANFNEFVSVALAGRVVSQVYERGQVFNLVVRADEGSRGNMESLLDMAIDCPDGTRVPLSTVAEVRSVSGPNTINRENAKRKIVVSANASGRDLGSVVGDIRQRVAESVTLPEGYHVEYGGQFESEQSASRTLVLASMASVLVIFLLLYAQFRRVGESAVVLINLPLALIGGVFAVAATSGEVSIPATIGFISLFGIATRNGMLLISRYDAMRQEGHTSLRQTIINGSLDRLNPILMTALCSALALIPLALRGHLPGNEIQSPMAKVILGGLLTSTLLNAFVLPIVYEMMHSKRKGRLGGGSLKYLTIACALAMATIQAPAQGMADVLRSIEQNNLSLQSMLKANEAEGLAMGADNAPEAPSVEYSPFFSPGTSGVASSELVVKQGFDFPTAYAARSKANRLERQALHSQYLTARRDILLQAKLLCIDMVYQRQSIDLARQRHECAMALEQVVEKRLAQGDATAIELNRVRIDRMGAATALAQAQADASATLLAMQALNGGHAIVCDSAMAYPPLPTESYDALAARAAAADHGVRSAQATLDAKAQQVKASTQSWLPKLEVGYRRNTSVGEAVNGFLVGASFPLFGTAGRVKAAKAQRQSATLALSDARQQAVSQANALASQLKQQRTVLDAYDTALLHATLGLLRQAVEEGQMSVADYYAEADGIYAALMDHCNLLRQHHQALAQLTCNEL